MKVTFTNKELEGFKEIAEILSNLKGPRGGQTELSKLCEHFIDKMEKAKEKAEVPRHSNTVSVQEFLTMARLIVGHKLKEQLNPSPIWYKQMQFRLDSRNITKGMATVGLENARDNWNGEIWIDTLINSIDKLSVMTPRNTSRSKLGWLKQIQDLDDNPE